MPLELIIANEHSQDVEAPHCRAKTGGRDTIVTEPATRIGAITPSSETDTAPAACNENHRPATTTRRRPGNSFDQVLRMRSVARHASIVHLPVIPVGEAADFR